MERLQTVLVALIVVLAGCSSIVDPGADANTTIETTETTAADATTTEPTENDESDGSDGEGDGAPPDPDEDVLGWEDGVWYNESIDVDQSDGLTDEEIEAYVSRAMARVEHIRGKEFKQRVPVEVVPRSQFANESFGAGTSEAQSDWNNQVWEALFISSEERNVTEELAQFYSAGVGGYYSPSEQAIVIVSDNPDNPVISNATLHHELQHALQDQYFDIGQSKYSGATQDGDLAIDGIVEGDANYVEFIYEDYCTNGTWECVSTPSSDSGGGGDVNFGIYVTVFNPYADGPAYVNELHEQGGWDAVDAAMESPPQTTETVIHRRSPQEAEEPAPIEFEDTAAGDWSLFENQGVDGYDTVGEVSIYSMFWYASYPRGLDLNIIDWRSLFDADGEYDLYNYDAAPSNGWANDRVYPYTSPSAEEDGYVWVTEWDTEQDAAEFRDAYLQILEGLDAEQVDENTWRVSDGQYADAFRVVIDGTRVVVVNGPSVEAVDELKPEHAPLQTNTSTTNASTTDAEERADRSTIPTANERADASTIPVAAVVAA